MALVRMDDFLLVGLCESCNLAITYAYSFAPEKAAITNAIAATYPALVSAVVLWYFLGEPMTIQKVFGLMVTVVGVVILVLS